MTYKHKTHAYITKTVMRMVRRLRWAHIKPIGNIKNDWSGVLKHTGCRY